MNERHEEKLALHALRMMDPHEARIVETELRNDPKMREVLAELESTAADLALLLPPETPPLDLRAAIFAEVKQRRRSVSAPIIAPFRALANPRVAWAAAAVLAIGIVGLWTHNSALNERVSVLVESETAAQETVHKAEAEKGDLEKKLAAAGQASTALTAELNQLKQTNALARMELATMRSSLNRYEDGVAVIVWDSEKQEGKLKLEKMPPVQANKDYQLWVVDKSKPQEPISAGVVKVNQDGSATMTFHPVEPISAAAGFAVSLEQEGGVPHKTDEGPVIMSGR